MLKPGGVLVATTIEVRHDLDDAEMQRTLEAAPPHPVTPEGYRVILERAGFVDVQTIDITAQYLETVNRWARVMAADTGELAITMGERFHERTRSMAVSAGAIARGHLTRTLLVARRGRSR